MKCWSFLFLASFWVIFGTAGCATAVPAIPEDVTINGTVVLGRAVTLLTGPTSRWYEPELRFLELVHRSSKERFRINIDSSDKVFILPLAAGEYEMTRVQIKEGPYMSMSDFGAVFEVQPDQVTYVGTWRFGVDSPGYNRMMVVSVVENKEDQEVARQEMATRYPDLADRSMTTVLPNPPSAQSRLYEVMPYPSVPRYFRRHWW